MASDSWQLRLPGASQLTANISTGHVSPKTNGESNRLCRKFSQLEAAPLTVFQLVFHRKEVTFSGRSLHRGWHRNFAFRWCSKMPFSAKVTPTARARSPCQHAQDEFSRIRRGRHAGQASLTDLSMNDCCWRERRASQEGTLASSSTATLPLPSQPASPPSLIGVAMWGSGLWLGYWVTLPPSWTRLVQPSLYTLLAKGKNVKLRMKI